jgi:transcriptional regulator with PAS, ATPase and Fis domain
VAAWIVAATNRDIEDMVRSGKLRSDLYFRINVLTLRLPNLRERGEDILLLARHFLERTARRYGFPAPELLPDASATLSAYAWPGSVRELKHLMERAVLVTRGESIGAAALSLGERTLAPRPDDASIADTMTLEEAERFLIERALARAENNVSEAARQLGVTRMAMRYRMKRHGL